MPPPPHLRIRQSLLSSRTPRERSSAAERSAADARAAERSAADGARTPGRTPRSARHEALRSARPPSPRGEREAKQHMWDVVKAVTGPYSDTYQQI